MNIFVSNFDPYESAIVLDDKRLIKMILETAQLMSTAINISGGMSPYKSTHVNHPCSKWVRESKSNYIWALNHFKSLSNEYTRRFGRVHKSFSYLDQFTLGAELMPESPLTPFKNCTPFKCIDDTIEAYKACLNEKWTNDKKPRWTNAKPPVWAKVFRE